MNPIGMMQGRLSPSIPGRVQAFHWNTWQQEFENARLCHLELIEWLFDAEAYDQNPIWSHEGRQEIKKLTASSGTHVLTCCATYFMAHPFFRVDEPERLESIRVLNQLVLNAAQIGLQTILLPVLEICEIRTIPEKEQLLESLHEPLILAEKEGINLGLETELPAADLLSLIKEGRSPRLGVYYDTGNNTAKGYDIVSDARMLAPYLVGIHIKDRKRGGSSVLLGEGDTDFNSFFLDNLNRLVFRG